MTALIDWSYNILTPREQRFLEWLSVFSGGCALKEATAICAIEREDDYDVIDLVASLVAKSLLVAELVGEGQRYRLLESTREYAAAKLISRGEQEKATRRHALVYLDLAQRLEAEREVMSDREWSPQAQAELENWRAALEWTLGKRRDVTLGQRLAAARGVICTTFTPAEGRHWVQAALALVDELTSPDLVVRLEHADAAGASSFGSKQVLAAAERAMKGYRGLGDALGFAQAQRLAGGALVTLGSAEEGEALLREALAAARTLGNRRLTINALIGIGSARSAVRDYAGARMKFTEALELANVVGAESFAAPVAVNLAVLEFKAGDPETALRLSNDLLTAYRVIEPPPDLSETLGAAYCNTAEYLMALGQYDEALEQANEALDFARRTGLPVFVALSVWHTVTVWTSRAQGRRVSADHRVAARLLGFVGNRRDTLGFDAADSEYDKVVARLSAAIGGDVLTHLMAVGAAMTEDEITAHAHGLK